MATASGFIVFQSETGVIVGAGTTEAEALAELRQQLATDEEIDDGVCVISATDRLLADLGARWSIRDGMADVSD